MTRTVLTIGGSDPTGGAGIQADIKTLTMLGVYGAAAITCVTVQNSHGVTAIQPLDPELVAAQIRAVLDDHHVHHVKIGMVGSTPIARAIGESLAGFEGRLSMIPSSAPLPVNPSWRNPDWTRSGGNCCAVQLF
ncbi:bifunctional hydroxymethylpyrimidine kinase/phosphomethylpyrimidine kinase [Desulfolithobacter dissulfuricans]|uniref:bifunctional hydroxymethylpyrimidine kinase/phosphomethylpyrimidine kinase n=1 Tax=Desulfolithobacter dissulfuricans TaxID=2795293 RepID=UPI002278F28C|nr:bifunctional hydroxymethylpyrimidine kinase/phosphomethylpyrimidine kinase [Desulfolithobacter dissulfuricans]